MVQKEARPRGRPRSFDTDEVLEKARAVFWNLGYAATSLDDLSEATGLNRPSLYGAFGDKHALYMAALERSRSEAIGGIRLMLSRPGSLREVMSALYASAIGVYQRGAAGQRGCFLIGTAVTQAVEDKAARLLMGNFLAEMDQAFASRFALAPDELAPGLDPEAAAPMASASLHSLAIRARAGADEATLHRVAQAALAAICRPPER